MLHKRTKPVNIRVTEDEFRTLREACEKMGARNLSELARDAMKTIVSTHKSEPRAGSDMGSWLTELECRLDSLQSEVKRLKDLVVKNVDK